MDISKYISQRRKDAKNTKIFNFKFFILDSSLRPLRLCVFARGKPE